jgi:hypothetical protein
MEAVSVEDRIAIFQSDLNTSKRSNLYQDFIPTIADYDALKTPSSAFDSIFPPAPPNYELTVMSESQPVRSNPTSIVVVEVLGPDGPYRSPYYLKLVMATDNGYDWTIQTLSANATIGAPLGCLGWTLLYQ